MYIFINMNYIILKAVPNPTDRFMNPVTGGGALMDMGCYLIQFATLILTSSKQPHMRLPDSVSASGLTAKTGVDIENAFVLQVLIVLFVVPHMCL
jgi:predicted dehydrogenase